MNPTLTTQDAGNKMRRRHARRSPVSGRVGLTVLLFIAIVAVAGVLWLKIQWDRAAQTAQTRPGHIRSVPVAIHEPRAEMALARTTAPPRASGSLADVLGRLKKLNPGFDPATAGERHTFEGGQVVELSFSSAGVTNVSPVAALTALRSLALDNPSGEASFADLSPVRGMPLTRLSLKNTRVADLSPLRGMALDYLDISGTAVTNLTHLAGMPLTALRLDMAMVQTKQDMQVLLDQLGALRTINDMPVAEFLQKAATAAGRWARAVKPVEDKFVTAVMAMPAEKQLPAVLAKMKDLNPAFDGVQQHRIEGGQITELYISTVGVDNIAPIRALQKLKRLSLSHWTGNGATTRGAVSDLSPLRGMALTMLACHNTGVSDLSPLRDMPLTILSCGGTQVSDLSPLTGMKLAVLSVDNTPVSDLSPLAGMPLTVLWCDRTKAASLAPLRGMPLKELRCDYDAERDYEVLSSIRTLAKINDTMATMFWMTAGKPSTTGKRSKKSP